MPLMHGKSKRAFEHNVEAEIHAGKPQKQAVAIAYSEQREARRKHMSSGGCMGLGCKHPSHYSEGGEVGEKEHDEEMKLKSEERNRMHKDFMDEHERIMSLPMPKMAEGGEVNEMEDGEEHEMMDMLADELMQAIERKDKKEILESIKAIVLSCRE